MALTARILYLLCIHTRALQYCDLLYVRTQTSDRMGGGELINRFPKARLSRLSLQGNVQAIKSSSEHTTAPAPRTDQEFYDAKNA